MTPCNPAVLLILDGWGHRSEKKGNAIACANTPHWDHLLKKYPHTLISGSGVDVGLPPGQMGNSEVGHLTIGSGRVIYQDLSRISHAIEDGSFFDNDVLKSVFEKTQQKQKAIHFLCLLSEGGVHSHEQHLFAALKMANALGCQKLFVHAFLDGRDTPPKSAQASLERLSDLLKTLDGAKLASLCGRYYAMDRDKRWDRIQASFEAIVYGKAPYQAHSALEALAQAYARNETDEFVKPTIILNTNDTPVTLQNGDSIVFMNFRNDRARELTSALISPDFNAFERGPFPQINEFVSLTEYDKTFDVKVAFKPQSHQNVLAEYLQNCHLKQLHLAETEKYAHVTFFFNGGVEKPFRGEQRILIPSPKVATYDLMPQMSAFELTQCLTENILKKEFDFIVCNLANADMVGHTGNYEATLKAIEVLDECIGKIAQAVENASANLLITADHGNAEYMFNPENGQIHTAHTSELVPLVYVGDQKITFVSDGKLCDIAPTLLSLMGLPKPIEMSGHSLIKEQ